MKEKCNQFKCAHNPDNDTIPKGKKKDMLCAMCPVCSCGCEPHIVETTCEDCIACETVPNHLRGSKKVEPVDIKISEKTKQEIILENKIGGDGK